jgi:hypothetical protein
MTGLITAAVLHGLNDRVADTVALKVNDRLRGGVKFPPVRADFITDRLIGDAILRHGDDPAIGYGSRLADRHILLVSRLALGIVALLIFIFGIADQSASRQSGESANGRSSSSAAKLFANDCPDGSSTSGPDDRTLLGIIHVRTTQAQADKQRTSDEALDNPL